jgi:hypothetical protein
MRQAQEAWHGTWTSSTGEPCTRLQPPDNISVWGLVRVILQCLLCAALLKFLVTRVCIGPHH